jgi:hypothetical protein
VIKTKQFATALAPDAALFISCPFRPVLIRPRRAEYSLRFIPPCRPLSEQAVSGPNDAPAYGLVLIEDSACACSAVVFLPFFERQIVKCW